MSSGTKRKVEELGGHVISAAVGDVVARTMSAAVGRYEARASVDDQLERLHTLAIMVHSAVEAAEDVHIRSWWLRRWLWTLLDADEVLRLFRQQRRAAVGADAASNEQAGGNMVWRALRSVKSLLLGRDDSGVERLSRMVARLEREAMGLGDFLKVLDLEIRRSLAVQQAPPPPVQSSEPTTLASIPPAAVHGDNLLICRSKVDENSSASPDGAGDRSRFDHGVSSISHEEYVAGMRKMSLLIVMQRIRRALDRLIRKKPPPAPPPPASRALTLPDTDRLREQVSRIQRAVLLATSGSDAVDFHSKRRSWLARWSNQLMTVACRAEYLLLAARPVQAGGDGDWADVIVAPRDVSDGRMRTTAQDVEAAAAHLEDFVTLTGFALASPLGMPCARS